MFALGNCHIIGVFLSHNVTFRREQFLCHQCALIWKRDSDLTVPVSGLRPYLSRYMRVRIPDAEGCTLQCNIPVSCFMLVNGKAARHGGVGERHGGFPVTGYEIGKLLHLGIAFRFRGRRGFRLCHYLTTLNLDDCAGGSFSDNGHRPGLHMGDTGIGRGNDCCLRGGVQKVSGRSLDLSYRYSGRIVVIFGVGPGKKPRSVVHFPVLHRCVGTI